MERVGFMTYTAVSNHGVIEMLWIHMDSTQYQQILKNNIQELVKRLKLHQVWLFHQDNEPKH